MCPDYTRARLEAKRVFVLATFRSVKSTKRLFGQRRQKIIGLFYGIFECVDSFAIWTTVGSIRCFLQWNLLRDL